MNEFIPTNKEIVQIVNIWYPKLLSLSEEVIDLKRGGEDWSIRLILGHLIDSASNNLQRIINLQYQPSPAMYPDYVNHDWLRIQNYEGENWQNMVQLWKYINLHIAHVIENVNPDKLENIWITAKGEKISLREMIVHYLSHLEHHLERIEELAGK